MGYGKVLKPSVSLTVDTDAYTANDVIGGLLTFDVSGTSINGLMLNTAIFVDAGDEGAALRLFLYDEVPSTFADDAAFAPTAADRLLERAVVTFGTYISVNSISSQIVPDINNLFSTDNGKIYGYLVANGSTPNPGAATDYAIQLLFLSE